MAAWTCPPLSDASIIGRAMDAKRLKALEEENAKLKKLLAEQMMDVSTLREMLGMERERHAFK